MSLSSILGWVGAIVLLISYLLNAFKVFSIDSMLYKFANLFGSAFLTYSAINLKAYPFVLINSLWFIVSIISILHVQPNKGKNNKGKKF